MKNKIILAVLCSALALSTTSVSADDYAIDIKGQHAFIQFKIMHLGYSWLYGRFNDFDGKFSYDEKNPGKSKVEVNIKTASIDSNHGERDKHLRGKDFLNVKKFPKAAFVSTSFTEKGNGKAELKGKLTLHGVTRPITIDITHVGAGKDPWGGYRRGFMGSTLLALKDFNINYDLGPASKNVELTLSIEGVRQ